MPKSLVPDMFVVSWQDFRSHRFGDRNPVVTKERMRTKEAADTRKRELAAMGMTACVTPLIINQRETASA